MKPFNIHDVIHDLTGTCMDLQEVLNDYGKDEDDLSQEDRQTIDAHIFCCDSCSWWCEVVEQRDTDNGDRLCEDCHESQVDDVDDEQ